MSSLWDFAGSRKNLRPRLGGALKGFSNTGFRSIQTCDAGQYGFQILSRFSNFEMSFEAGAGALPHGVDITFGHIHKGPQKITRAL
jgi:hypothetical protein